MNFQDSRFLTITYKEAKFGVDCYEPKDMFIRTIGMVLKRIHKVSVDYLVSPEFTHGGNIHYHIIFSFESVNQMEYFYLKILPAMRRDGFIKIVTIKNMAKCQEYIRKDIIFIQNLLQMKEGTLPLRSSFDLKIYKRDRFFDDNPLLDFIPELQQPNQ